MFPYVALVGFILVGYPLFLWVQKRHFSAVRKWVVTTAYISLIALTFAWSQGGLDWKWPIMLLVAGIAAWSSMSENRSQAEGIAAVREARAARSRTPSPKEEPSSKRDEAKED